MAERTHFRAWHVALALATLTVLSAATVLRTDPTTDSQFLAGVAVVMGGPLTGWWLAVARDALPGALGLLIPGTLVPGIPIAIYCKTRGGASLAYATWLWWCSGWFFGVAIWT